ncbi:hypothetical protein BDR05DRAFT_854218, partial [Suillus weaverae]
AACTVTGHPKLFKLVTLINVDQFQALLVNHPNQPFIQSVCQALQEGFWPWADASNESYPSINDKLIFIEEQLEEEIPLGQVSESFGTDLLPGMYSILMHMVAKPTSDKLCLVVDHTAGKYSLNSIIDSDSIKGTKLNGSHSLGASL